MKHRIVSLVISLLIIGGMVMPCVGRDPDGEVSADRINRAAAAVSGDDWLTTDGDKILDMNGNEVWLTGVNWFGYNTGTNIFDGVWSCNMDSTLRSIADHGFNLLRVPISAELLLQWASGQYPVANYNHYLNPELEGLNSLQIFDHALATCSSCGLKVMLDIHSAETDAMGHNAPLWYTDKISADQYLQALNWVSARYASNDTIVAYDLKNEPHGAASESHAIWNGSADSNNWRYMAERAGNTILGNNPHALIVVEGVQIYPTNIDSNNYVSNNDGDYFNTWWGGNLRGVAKYPVRLLNGSADSQVVYSPHDYGPAVYRQPWFYDGFTYDSLKRDCWYDNWLYIDDQKIAPILIGEWGGFMEGDNLTWMTYLRQLIIENHLNHTFWCFNANSGDTGGLVLGDFTTWDNEKYSFVEPALWQDDQGRYISLDHQVPLGSNGISLSDYYGNASVPSDPIDLTDAVDMNPGGTADFVERLYTVALGRESDPYGKSDWVSRISQGLSAAECARGFLYSDEFINNGNSNSVFLDILYRTFFDREADQYGKNNWLALMNSGMSREEVITGFINSIEWANLCLTFGIESGGTASPTITVRPNDKIIAFAMRLYTTCLGRDFDPNGLEDWSGRLANHKITGTEAAYGFFFSNEFTGYGLDNAEYIKRLYRTFMDRESDPQGFDYWMNKLNSGVSRLEVFYGFADSVEFGTICSNYGIIR